MSRPLPRYTNTTQLDQANINRAVGNTNATDYSIHPANPAELRGIPCLAKGVGGTSPNTNPLTETIRRNP